MLFSAVPTNDTPNAVNDASTILCQSLANQMLTGSGRYAKLKTSFGFRASTSVDKPLAKYPTAFSRECLFMNG
jgi:hypothetical protein